MALRHHVDNFSGKLSTVGFLSAGLQSTSQLRQQEVQLLQPQLRCSTFSISLWTAPVVRMDTRTDVEAGWLLTQAISSLQALPRPLNHLIHLLPWLEHIHAEDTGLVLTPASQATSILRFGLLFKACIMTRERIGHRCQLMGR